MNIENDIPDAESEASEALSDAELSEHAETEQIPCDFSESDVLTNQLRSDLAPHVKFSTADEILSICKTYADHKKFLVIKKANKYKDGQLQAFYVNCNRSGKVQDRTNRRREDAVPRPGRKTIKCGCEWGIYCVWSSVCQAFEVQKLNLEHMGGCQPSYEQRLVTAKARGHAIPLEVIKGAVPFIGCSPTVLRYFLCQVQVESIH